MLEEVEGEGGRPRKLLGVKPAAFVSDDELQTTVGVGDYIGIVRGGLPGEAGSLTNAKLTRTSPIARAAR